MAGDTPSQLHRDGESPIRVSDLLALAEWMRELVADSKNDLRVEIGARHDLLVTKVDALTATQRDYVAIHAQEHLADEAAMKEWRGRLNGFVDAARLAKARQDGLLGAAQFAVNLIGRNWRGLTILVAGIALVLGNVHVNIA